MGFYDMSDEQQNLLDYDIIACLEYNTPNDARICIENLHQVIAIHEGERDMYDWQWIVTLKDGRVAYLEAGCDYTGWD